VIDKTFEPYRQLALRVIVRACMDAANPGGAETDRESARVFLAGSPMLVLWCRVAGLDSSCLAALARVSQDGTCAPRSPAIAPLAAIHTTAHPCQGESAPLDSTTIVS
jgi:hypothetical protein